MVGLSEADELYAYFQGQRVCGNKKFEIYFGTSDLYRLYGFACTEDSGYTEHSVP